MTSWPGRNAGAIAAADKGGMPNDNADCHAQVLRLFEGLYGVQNPAPVAEASGFSVQYIRGPRSSSAASEKPVEARPGEGRASSHGCLWQYWSACLWNLAAAVGLASTVEGRYRALRRRFSLGNRR
jgi:hypothetical protein